MISDKQIAKWLDVGLINEKQSKKMLDDIHKAKEDSKSKKLIVTFSTIGALLLGIGAILFIGSNWRLMSNIAKFIVLLLSTSLSYYIGHYLKFQNKNFPHVGSALIFLSSLLFGATVILTAQMYNWNANSHWLVFIWMLGIVPLVYLYNSKPIASLMAVLIYVWIGLLVFRGLGSSSLAFREFISLYFASGSLMMSFGAYHYLNKKLASVARIYRLMGLKVMMIVLFSLTFKSVSTINSYQFNHLSSYNPQLVVGIVTVAVISAIFMLINLFINPAKIKTALHENILGLVLLSLILVFYFFPSTSLIYAVIFNLIFAGLIFLLIYLGNVNEDMSLINLGMIWLAIFLIVKYFDFFFKMLPNSLFMIIGGIILVSGSVALEKKRRKIKQEFGEQK